MNIYTKKVIFYKIYYNDFRNFTFKLLTLRILNNTIDLTYNLRAYTFNAFETIIS